jgi:phosphoribosylglycinamide formyltransferase 1
LAMVKLGVLGSGGGSNFQAVYEQTQPNGILHGLAEVTIVISNNSNAGILERARKAGIPIAHLSGYTHPNHRRLDTTIRQTLWKYRVELVILAGYMKKVGLLVRRAYPGYVLNIHPALDLKRFGGPGMYGLVVHEAVIASKVKFTGATVHLADQQYDHGQIVMQSRRIRVQPDDTPPTLAARVLIEEHKLYPRAIKFFIEANFKEEI